jgi:hypothetical protein
MDNETAQIALQFLQRVNLTGSEVSAYLKVLSALQQAAQAQPDAPPDEPVNGTEATA